MSRGQQAGTLRYLDLLRYCTTSHMHASSQKSAAGDSKRAFTCEPCKDAVDDELAAWHICNTHECTHIQTHIYRPGGWLGWQPCLQQQLVQELLRTEQDKPLVKAIKIYHHKANLITLSGGWAGSSEAAVDGLCTFAFH